MLVTLATGECSRWEVEHAALSRISVAVENYSSRKGRWHKHFNLSLRMCHVRSYLTFRAIQSHLYIEINLAHVRTLGKFEIHQPAQYFTFIMIRTNYINSLERLLELLLCIHYSIAKPSFPLFHLACVLSGYTLVTFNFLILTVN